MRGIGLLITGAGGRVINNSHDMYNVLENLILFFFLPNTIWNLNGHWNPLHLMMQKRVVSAECFQVKICKSSTTPTTRLFIILFIIYKLGYLKKDCMDLCIHKHFRFILRSSYTQFFVLFQSCFTQQHKCFNLENFPIYGTSCT